MNTATIRQHLHNYLDIADDKKLKALYVMVEDDLLNTETVYTQELKDELDRRVNNYLSGGTMVTPDIMNNRIQALRKKRM